MVRSFLDTWGEASKWLPVHAAEAMRIGLLTGRLAERILAPLVTRLNAIENVQIDLLPVDNDFFGHGITVSGLLTGRDMAARVRDGIQRDLVLLPPNCVNGEGLTLDDMTVPQLAAEVGVPLAVGGYDLVESLERFWTDQSVKVQGEGRQLTELGYYIGRDIGREK